MRLSEYHRIYLIGIGGIGMSALARWFASRGQQVAGYDRTSTPLTNQLIAEGIHIHFDDNPALIDESFTSEPERTLVIYTPAIPSTSLELAYFKERGFKVEKRSKILGIITKELPTIAVAGTHGKTTTSAMVAHILHAAGQPCVAFVGGITQNYATNLIISGEDSDRLIAVVEADEYDRSFLQLNPDVAILTSVDADHLDIYGSADELLNNYNSFLGKVKSKGRIVLQNSLLSQVTLPKGNISLTTYGQEEGETKALDIKADADAFTFDLVSEDFSLPHLRLAMPGYHNVENATAAAIACFHFGITPHQIRSGLESFMGVKRRFEILISTPATVYIDDYAHHPTEIEALISSVRKLYPGRHITAIFQPHLFSRTRDFAAGFGRALSLPDRVLLLDIYPARELPIPGVNSAMLLPYISVPDVQLTSLDSAVALLTSQPTSVVLTIGAGDISRIVPLIVQALSPTPAA